MNVIKKPNLPRLTVPSLIVTGTDTGIGKTYVSSGILRAWQEKGLSPLAFKPFVSGINDAGTWEDTEVLRNITGQTVSAVSPVRFDLPMAPAMAQEVSGLDLDWHLITEQIERLNNLGQPVLIEGVGGWDVPLDMRFPGYNFGHFAAQIGGNLVIVTRPNLGTLNHTSLTVRAIHADAPNQLIGTIVNHAIQMDISDASIAHSISWLEKMSNMPVLAHVKSHDITWQQHLSDMLLPKKHGFES